MGGVPVRIKDIAEVRIGRDLRTGSGSENGREVVIGTALMLIGENSRTVSAAVDVKMTEIRRSLPPSVEVQTVLNRTLLVEATIKTVAKNLAEGAAPRDRHPVPPARQHPRGRRHGARDPGCDADDHDGHGPGKDQRQPDEPWRPSTSASSSTGRSSSPRNALRHLAEKQGGTRGASSTWRSASSRCEALGPRR